MSLIGVIVGIALFIAIAYVFFTKKTFLVSLAKTLIIGFILTLILVAFASYLVFAPLKIKISPIAYSY
ncbi:MAG: hypothetical protein QW719_03565, partial [Candidatus Micrarchaeaceae archaeon]